MPQEMSDADVFGPDVHSLVTAAADRYGIPPAILHNVAHTESRYNQDAVSPKGAVGVMQLMPGTARDLGVDPTNAAQNVDGGARYLKAQHDRFGDWRLAAAAYNAGPGAVEKHGGVPPYPETQKYVDAVAPQAEMSDADVFGPAAPQAAPAGFHVVGASHNGGVTISVGGAAPPKPNVGADVAASYGTGVKQGAASMADQIPTLFPGVAQLRQAADLMYRLKHHEAQAPAPAMPNAVGAATSVMSPDHAPQTWQGRTALTAGQMTPAAFGGEGSILARLGNVAIPTAVSSAAGETARAMGANPLVEQILRTVGAVGGGGLASLRMTPKAQRTPNILGDVKAATNDAYAAMRAKGDVIPQEDVRGLAGAFEAAVKDKAGPDPKAYLASMDMVSRLKAMAKSKDGVSLDQLDTLRSDVYDSLVKSGDRESPLGVALRGMIDETISKTGNPDILKARDLNTRAAKIEDIQNEVKSARLRASTANSGQNVNNSIRQELRPLIDPTRNQQITNLTPDELAAMTRAVSGSKGQNAMRDASNILRNRFLQGMLVVPTAGAVPAAMEVGGRMLNRAAENSTMANVQKVIDLIAAGHPGSAAPAITATRAPLLAAPNASPLPLSALMALLPLTASARPKPAPAKPQRR